DRNRDRDDAGEAESPARGDGARLGLDHQRAVLVKAAGGQLVDDFSPARRQADQIAVAADEDLRHAGTPGELGMFGKMQRLAMRRNKDLRPYPADHVAQLVASGMPRDVDQ